jgi:DNA replicative helicase MCM subunit Mcm2 (Cdc46/Mcm family)
MTERRYDIRIDPDLQLAFTQRSEDPEVDALDWLWEHVCPEMTGRRRARTAALLSLASEPDRNGVRGRIHCLFPGPGGTGKTVLKDWVKYTMRDAVGCGPDSSGAGLRYNANTGQLGKLAQAHHGTICIEEFDKFEREGWTACYESMSEGYFEVDKGGMSDEIPSQCRVIAVCNEVPFPQPLMTRFDFVIEMDDYDTDETVDVSADQYDHFREAFVEDSDEPRRPLLPQYLSWIEDFRPSLDAETHREVVRLLERLIRERGETGDIRGKLAYLRVAYTIAKLNHRDVSVSDWVRAVELIHPGLEVRSLFSDAV